MADESLDQTPDDSIASALASAIAQHEPESTASAAAEKPIKDASTGAQHKAEQSDADEAEGTSSASEESVREKQASSETPAGADDKAQANSKGITEAPKNWSAKDKETFKKLAPDAQKFLLDRHKAMEGDYVKKTQAIAAFKREYEPVDKMFEPYRDRMKAGGWTPGKLIEGWMGAEKRLLEGDGVNVVASLIKGYQIDLGAIARALGLRPRQPQTNGHTQPNGEAPPEPQRQQTGFQLPPELSQALQSIQTRLDARDRHEADSYRRAQTDLEQRVMSEIEEFKTAQDSKGNALHPHFDEVEEAMTHLAQSARAARKPVPSLAQLYETAVWANPSTREATLAARERSQQEKAQAEARAKAAQARKAGSSVSGAPGPGGQAISNTRRTERSLRDELEEAFAGAQPAGRI